MIILTLFRATEIWYRLMLVVLPLYFASVSSFWVIPVCVYYPISVLLIYCNVQSESQTANVNQWKEIFVVSVILFFVDTTFFVGQTGYAVPALKVSRLLAAMRFLEVLLGICVCLIFALGIDGKIINESDQYDYWREVMHSVKTENNERIKSKCKDFLDTIHESSIGNVFVHEHFVLLVVTFIALAGFTFLFFFWATRSDDQHTTAVKGLPNEMERQLNKQFEILAALRTKNAKHKFAIQQDLLVVDIRTKDKFQTTALMLAARAGKLACVQVLVGKHANGYLLDSRGRNVLHYACESGNVKVVLYLICKFKLSPTQPDGSGMVPLMLCPTQKIRLNIIKEINKMQDEKQTFHTKTYLKENYDLRSSQISDSRPSHSTSTTDQSVDEHG